MEFVKVDSPQKHTAIEWRSLSGLVSVVGTPIIGGVRVQVWYDIPNASCPDILRCLWDCSRQIDLLKVIADVLHALGQLPESACREDVQGRLLILMYEHYGDIFDGTKARPQDRLHPDYNPHANPWWHEAQQVRAQFTRGINRHDLAIDLGRPPLGDALPAVLDHLNRDRRGIPPGVDRVLVSMNGENTWRAPDDIPEGAQVVHNDEGEAVVLKQDDGVAVYDTVHPSTAEAEVILDAEGEEAQWAAKVPWAWPNWHDPLRPNPGVSLNGNGEPHLFWREGGLEPANPE